MGWGDGNTNLSLMPWLERFVPHTRKIAGVPDEKVYRISMPEITALTQLKYSGRGSEEIFSERNLKFQKRIPQQLISEAEVIIGFDTSSHYLVERVHAAGKKFILDASIAHPRAKERIYEDLRKAYPQWAGQSQAKSEEMIMLEEAEMNRADAIAVASAFTRSTYIDHGIDPAKIHLNPYGTDTTFFKSKWNSVRRREPGQPVVFAFMGNISARKGIPQLLEAWRNLHAAFPQAKLLLAGNGGIPHGVTVPKGVELQPFIAPGERLAFLHSADVFVFPSYFEGFGQVILEAMAAGLPVISTTHTAAPELMRDGVEGFITSPGDDGALLQAMRLLATNPQQIEIMGRAAAEAAQQFTWEAYGNRWVEIIRKVAVG